MSKHFPVYCQLRFIFNSLWISFLILNFGFVSYAKGDPLQTQVQVINNYIEQDNIVQAKAAIDKLWDEYESDDGFVAAVRSIKDKCWMKGEFETHFALCEQLIEEFPNSDEIMDVWADDITGYIRTQNSEKAMKQLDKFWSACNDEEGFILRVRYIKDVCWVEEDYTNHFDICDRVVEAFPDDSISIRIAADCVTGYIRLGKMDVANEKLQGFWQEYGSHDLFIDNIIYVKDVCWLMKEYDEHFELCDKIASTFLDDSRAMQMRVDEITGYVKLGKESNAEEKIKVLLEESTEDSQLPEAVRKVADCYREKLQFEKAQSLYNTITTNWPEEKSNIWIRAGQAIVESELNSDPNVVANELAELKAEYAGDDDIDMVMFEMAYACYSKGLRSNGKGEQKQRDKYFDKAAEIWEDMDFDNISDHEAMRGNYLLGDCHRKRGDFTKSNQYFKKVVDDSNDEGMASNSLLVIAKNFRDSNAKSVGNLKQVDLIDSYEGTAAVSIVDPNDTSVSTVNTDSVNSLGVNGEIGAYKLLTEKYPETPAGIHAKRVLSHLE